MIILKIFCYPIVFFMSCIFAFFLPATISFALAGVVLLFPVAVINDDLDCLWDFFKEVSLIPIDAIKFLWGEY